MFGSNCKHSLATVAVAAGLLAAPGSASAGAHQHNQPDLEFLVFSPQRSGSEGVKDGTSNTIAFRARAAAPKGFAIDIGTSENIASDGLGADFNLMAGLGGGSGR
jgi:hypothetical protein